MRYLSLFIFAAVLAAPVTAQTVYADDDWCDESRSWSSDAKERHCEVREFKLSPRDLIRVDAGKNGGVHVEGWDRDEIVLRARVEALARSESDAKALADQIAIETDGTIRPRVPEGKRNRWASVSFELMVPRHSNLDLEAINGGIGIESVTGEIRFDAQNGGVHLSDLGGDVRGRTQNGGLNVVLTGTRWDGDRIDVETQNGGVDVEIPDDYSAEFETGTVNGRLRIDFPVMMEGDIGRRLRTMLGDGGALVRVTTTNGGVEIKRG